MGELPGLEGDYEEPLASAKSPTRYDIEKNLDNCRTRNGVPVVRV